MKQKYVKDLKVSEILVSVPFAVQKAERRVAKNGKEYMDVTLADRTGSILGRIWSEKFVATMVDILSEGMVVFTNAQVSEYQDKLQLIVTGLSSAYNYDDEDFIPVSNRDLGEMMTELRGYIAQIKDRNLHKLLENIFAQDEMVELFQKTPAAMKMHHAYKGGLLEHVLEVLAIAVPMVKIYPSANLDLVMAGIILHDIGKVEEIVWKNLSIEYSTKGKLFGHIIIGLEIIDRYKGENFDAECERLLKHIILSHHGKLEFGAQVIPATMEGKIVSLADDASAKLRSYQTSLDNAQESASDFSEYSKAIETMVYRKEYVSK